ncbi:hypothetical protein [Kibdelosporangium phytohabitans]|uniref:Protein kinase domain-containing protein n=1 Tax=Kibdelosporangium phytohabitans TaxID=860235 RepID=A0A0N9I4V4_9PSEU|nr:hypothetical protein [Kibdelosporangium phytohabitans]ALG09604.1 hypothetical protein AOZ06_24280 [Kibdelosporangium phytohabitans]MBE1469059.1 hypothetical protein [Kibdelosporangium phytohabitans]
MSTIELRYRDAWGHLFREHVTPGDPLHRPGANLPATTLTGPGGRRLTRKWVPCELGADDATSYDLLDNEIRTLTRLRQVFTTVPPQLPELVGYDLDAEEPYVLLGEYRGLPGVLTAGRLDLHQHHRFRIGLLRAVAALRAEGIAHGAIGLGTVRWDGTGVQLVDFELARHADGAGDVRDAAVAIREMVLGPLPDRARPDLTGDPGPLRALLGDVFDATARPRPDATHLLVRLRATTTAHPKREPSSALEPGHRLFDSLSIGKRSIPKPPPPPRPTVTPGKQTIRGIVLVTAVVLVVIAVIMAVMV